MITETMQNAINQQIARELYSSNLYLAMAAYYSNLNLNGFANWMRVQAQEEMVHALKFFDYMISRGAKPVITQINAPKTEWNSPFEAFQDSYEHEKLITAHIHDLVNLSIKENDHASHIFLQWFVTEQVEEESTVFDIVTRMKMMENFPGGLYLIDNELKQRKFGA
jgi:ferritin